jgi:hypothetical protein
LTGQRRRKRRRGWKKSLSAMLTHTRNGGRSIDHRASTFFFRLPPKIDSQLFDGTYFSSSYLVIWTNLKEKKKKISKIFQVLPSQKKFVFPLRITQTFYHSPSSC